MVESFRVVVYEGGTGEIVEKKSRFIASVLPVNSEEEAVEFIEKMKKKYWDASHNCSAFIIGKRAEIQRCSDDGEPGGTAGKPMLEVLLAEKICNVVVVCTRYFGGTLLGTGGLVRAYTAATQKGLENSVIIEKQLGTNVEIISDYNEIGKLQYIAAQLGVTITDTVYTDLVTTQFIIPIAELNKFKDEIIEKTNGKVKIEEKKDMYFAMINKECIIFEDV